MIRHLLHRCSSMRHHRLSFLAATTALASTATTASKPFGTPSHLPASFQTSTNYSRFFHQSNGTSTSSPWDDDKTQHHQDTLNTLKTLVHRLTQPPPLRAPTQHKADVSSSATPSSSSPPFEEKRRLTELAKGFLDGYQDLPPMRLPARELEDDSSSFVTLHPCQRFQILRFLSTDCVPSVEAVETAVQKYERRLHHHQPSGGVSEQEAFQLQKHSIESLSHLRNVLTPPYEELFAFLLQQNAIDAMAFLVSLREDLLQLQRYWKLKSADHTNEISSGQLSQLQEVDKHLQSVFTTWFAPGMLELRRITYDQTSASIIEFISLKEAVHPMKSLEDLRRRLGPKRRVLALFHPLLPEKPLVFVHIALIEPKEGEEDQSPVSLVPSSMEDVITMDEPERRVVGSMGPFTPKVATFYSISNGVKGLSGVGLGEILLKRAIESLRENLPSLEIFVTLSPIPGFRKWLRVKLEQHNDETLLSVHDRQQLVECGLVSSTEDTFSWGEFWDTLESIDLTTLLQGSHNKEENDSTAKQKDVLRDVLTKLACRYLALEKHRGKPLDGVCKFHVGNGAQLHNVHFGADLSRNGVNNSFGIMCNYLYDLDQLDQNCASFESNYTVPIGASVYQWLQS